MNIYVQMYTNVCVYICMCIYILVFTWGTGAAVILSHYLVLDGPIKFLQHSREASSSVSICSSVLIYIIVTCSFDGRATLRLLRGATWPAIQTRAVKTSLCFQNSSRQIEPADPAKDIRLQTWTSCILVQRIQAPNMIFGAGRSCRKQPIGSSKSCLQHVNRTTDITAEAVDSPEALSLRGDFTRAAGKRMNISVDSRTTFGFMTAILQVLEGMTWPPIPFILVQTGLWPKSSHIWINLQIEPADPAKDIRLQTWTSCSLVRRFKPQIWYLERVDLAQHVNRTTGITAEAVDSPEALSLRGGFTRAAGKRMNIRVDSRTAFGFMTAILQVLDRIAWPWFSDQSCGHLDR